MLERDEMIIPKEPRLTSQEESELEEITGEFDIHLQKIEGEHQTVYAMVGDERHELLINRLEGLEYIARLILFNSPTS